MSERRVTWWLSVSHGGKFGGNLYVRRVPMDHLPEAGDAVLYFASEEEPDGAVSGYVKSRHWDNFGNAHLEFQNLIIDPDEHMPDMPGRIDTYWWTDRDGEVEPYLALSGWKKYGEEDN